jgi:hypothetical protein
VLSPHESDLSATLTLHPDKKDTTLILLEVQSCYEVNGQLYIAQNSKGQALDIITILPAGQQPEMKKKKVARSKKKVIIGARGQHEPESTEERMDIPATDVDSWPEG